MALRRVTKVACSSLLTFGSLGSKLYAMRRATRSNPAAGPRIRSGPGGAVPRDAALPSVTDHGAAAPISARAVTGAGAVRAVTTTVAARVSVKGAR